MGKKSAQINVAVTPADYARACALHKTHGVKPTEMARIGLLEVMNRLENKLAPVTPAEVVAITEARALGIDAVAAIRNAIAELERDRELRQIGGKVGILTPEISP